MQKSQNGLPVESLILFCESADDDQAVDNAKAYCREYGHTFDKVRIYRKGGFTYVAERV